MQKLTYFQVIQFTLNAQASRKFEAIINQKLSICQVTFLVLKITTNFLCNIRKELNKPSNVTQ